MRALLVCMVAASALVTACGSSGPPKIEGVWQPDDGSGTKTIQSDGRCSGMYYSAGQPLDIGGGMTCTLGSEPDEAGRYPLQVEQPPNSQTLRLDFIDDDQIEVYQGGDLLLTMTRQ